MKRYGNLGKGMNIKNKYKENTLKTLENNNNVRECNKIQETCRENTNMYGSCEKRQEQGMRKHEKDIAMQEKKQERYITKHYKSLKREEKT